MTLDGKWALTLETPMGKQVIDAEFKADGDSFSGSQSNPMMGTTTVKDGKIDGNALSWKTDLTQPMALTFEYEGTLDGDTLNGSVKGPMGAFPFAGARA